MSCSTETNIKPSRAKKKHSKSPNTKCSNNISSKKKKHKTVSKKSSKKQNKTKQYIPLRPIEISKNYIDRLKKNDTEFFIKNTALKNEEIVLFKGRCWNQKVSSYNGGNSKGLSITIQGCDKRMSTTKDGEITENELKSMLLSSDNNYMYTMYELFDGYLNGIRSILDIILLYKGRHLLPIRCHIDLFPYFHEKVRLDHYNKSRKKLWNEAIKDTETGMVTIEWIPDENIFIIEDIYDEWRAHIKKKLLLRMGVNEEAIFYIPDGDIFMAIHSNERNHKNNVLLQKNIFTKLYINGLTNFHQYTQYAFCMDLAGFNYQYHRTFYRESSWGSRSRCWSGDGLVLLSDGTRKCIKDLCINDKVAVLQKLPNGVVTGYKIGTVMVKIESVVNREYDMVYVDNKVWITPYHAVLVNNDNMNNNDDMNDNKEDTLKWKMPCNINKIQQRFVTNIYNFILDVGHVLNVNGVWANTLGHNLKGDVIQNPFWGNSRAMNQYWSQKEGYPNIVEYI